MGLVTRQNRSLDDLFKKFANAPEDIKERKMKGVEIKEPDKKSKKDKKD